MSAATKLVQPAIRRALVRELERERKRIIDAITAKFGLDRARVEETVRGRFRGVLSEAKA